MILSCIQPCFVPWLGYFEQIARADIFVYLDDVYYTKKDWRNNNQLKSPYSIKNIYIPVHKTSRETLINQVFISYNEKWETNLINRINEWYRKAPLFEEITILIESIIQNKYERLIDLNFHLNNKILKYIGIETPIYFSSEIEKKSDNKNQRIIEICEHFKNVDLLYDGKSAMSFINIPLFQKHGIEIIFQDYQHTPYPQLWDKEFVPYLSVIDLLMNCGTQSKQIILGGLVQEKMNKENQGIFQI